MSAGSGFGHVFVFTRPGANCIAFRPQRDGAVTVGAGEDAQDALCRIRACDAGFVLETPGEQPDMPVSVNARPAGHGTLLKDGDAIRVGPTVFRFETRATDHPSLQGRDLSEEQGMAKVYEALKAMVRAAGVGREAAHHHGALRR